MSVAAITGAFDEAGRVRLGASPECPVNVLRALAADVSVTVRAAVAMNSRTPAEADRILAEDADERVRMLLARKLAGITVMLGETDESRLTDQVFQLLRALVEDEATRVRAAIADAVKEMPNAPRKLILRLARDTSMSVAEPVIRLSPLLTSEDLLALLACMPCAETATAIARRPNLTEAVSDAIATRADNEAILALLANRSALIREATLDSLIAQAAHQVEWHEPLVLRPALPARAARALSEIVSTQLLDVLSTRADLDPALIVELRHRLTERLAQSDADVGCQTELTPDAAMRRAKALAAEGRLTEEALLQAAQSGESRLASALLAVGAGLPLSVVDRAALLRSAKGLISLCWKAGFSMRVAGPLQSLLARLPPASALEAGPGGAFPLAVAEMRWHLKFLERAGR
ncbi:MAG: DUF2336 domain-containing protein [Acetobacteraceae bacterium]|nr:DUF2336 domain-containing protein [Acetobacteraceae bacterium]